jgi:hypothetical protein
VTTRAAAFAAFLLSAAGIEVRAATNVVQSAIARFWAQEKTPASRAFARDKLGPVATKTFHAGIAQCRTGERGDPGELVGVVLVLDAKGSAAEVLVVDATPLQRCVAKVMAKAKYPAPPDIPFYYPLVYDPKAPSSSALEQPRD